MYPPSHEIIDLEESTETGSNEDQSSQNSTHHLKNVANLHQGLSIYSLNSDILTLESQLYYSFVIKVDMNYLI